MLIHRPQGTFIGRMPVPGFVNLPQRRRLAGDLSTAAAQRLFGALGDPCDLVGGAVGVELHPQRQRRLELLLQHLVPDAVGPHLVMPQQPAVESPPLSVHTVGALRHVGDHVVPV